MEGLPNFNFLPDDYDSEFSCEKKKDKSKEKPKDGKLKSSRFLSFLTREESGSEEREMRPGPLQAIEGGGESVDSTSHPELAVVPERNSELPETAQFEVPHVVRPEVAVSLTQTSENTQPDITLQNPSKQETVPAAEPSKDRFSKWMLEAGFDPDFVSANAILAEQSVKPNSLEDVHDPSVEASQEANDSQSQSAEQDKDDSREFMNRNKARRSSLIAFAAGLLIGNHFGKERVRRELEETNTKLEKLEASDRQNSLAGQQREREEYNRQYWRLSNANKQPITGDIAGEQDDAEGNPFDRKPETHVERDAWHSIVVDKYNHEDIDARNMYGKEFLSEQREVMQQQPSDQQYAGSSIGVNGPTDDTQQAQQNTQHQIQQNNFSLPDGITDPELPSGQPVKVDPQHLLKTASKQSVSLAVNPWVWLILGLLILVFFVASLL
jgi:hypothetical protein